MKKQKKKTKVREVPEKKRKLLNEIVDLINKNNTIMIALIENLSSTQFQKLKKVFSGKATVRVIKKSLLLRALEKAKEKKKGVELLEKSLARNFAVLFSNQDPFSLAALLSENKTNAFARPGYIAKEDIVIEAGPTDLPAGPVISELSKAKIKASIDGGKIVIREKSVVAKKGEPVSQDVANVLTTLEIAPVVVSILPIAAYDSKDERVYYEIKVDKSETVSRLKEVSSLALNVALNLRYFSKETIKFLLIKANSDVNALQNKMPKENPQDKQDDTKDRQDNTQNKEENKEANKQDKEENKESKDVNLEENKE